MPTPIFNVLEIYKENTCHHSYYFSWKMTYGDVEVSLPEYYFGLGEENIFQQMIKQWYKETTNNPYLLLELDDKENFGIFYRNNGDFKDICITTDNKSTLQDFVVTFPVNDENLFIESLEKCSLMLWNKYQQYLFQNYK